MKIFRWRRHRFEYIPGAQVSSLQKNRFITEGSNPWLCLRDLTGRFPRGRCLIRYTGYAENGALDPVLYYDEGDGFNEVSVQRLPISQGQRAEKWVYLPDHIKGMRLYPVAQVGEFTLRQFEIIEASRLQAARHLAVRVGIKAVQYPLWFLRSVHQALAVVKHGGIAALKARLIGDEEILNRLISRQETYAHWIALFDTLADSERQRILASIAEMKHPPLISIVMPVYNTAAALLEKAIDSVLAQLYPHWELCIADDASSDKHVKQIVTRYQSKDARIKSVFRETNGHISVASNAALALATGEFVAFLDHDDELSEHALFWVAETIKQYPGAQMIYSDEDKVDVQGKRFDPHFKCDFNYELLLAQHMICHLAVYRRTVLEKIGGFRIGFEGSQDYDLALRVIEQIKPDEIIHIPRVLYHWRASVGSTALTIFEKDYVIEAGRRAVEEHLQRQGKSAVVMPAPGAPHFNRVRFALPERLPLVSIIIPTRDRADLLSMCVDMLLEKTTYPNYEIIILDNGSIEPEALVLLDRLQQRARVTVVRDESPFNFSVLNNRAAQFAKGELLCLMNNDIEVVTPDWLEEMVSFVLQPDVAAVGARLWYPDGRLQHGGVVLGIGGVAGHSHKYLGGAQTGYFCRAILHQEFSAVTAACLLVRADIYRSLHGLDEKLAIAFNDIDFCMRIKAAGLRIVWTPYAEMIHHESASRGHEDTEEKQARFMKEVRFMQRRWGDKLQHDPVYNPNLTLTREDFSYAWPPRLEQTQRTVDMRAQ